MTNHVAYRYEKDFFGWVNEQVNFLRNKEYERLDMDNLIDEVECLGKSEKRMLGSYIENLLMHMLKVKYQPENHTKSWDLTIKISKHKALDTLEENLSLKPKLKKIFDDSYTYARVKAAQETGLTESLFPIECPWLINEIFPDIQQKYCI